MISKIVLMISKPGRPYILFYFNESKTEVMIFRPCGASDAFQKDLGPLEPYVRSVKKKP